MTHLWPVEDRIERARQGKTARQVDSKPLFEIIPLYPKQNAIISDPSRFTITEATTKAGKTASHIEWLLQQAIETGNGNWWWVATTSDTADIAYRRTRERLRGYLDSGGTLVKVGEPIAFTKNDTRKIINVAGATIWFKSAEIPDNLFGEDVYGAVGDEITRWREAAWVALYSTLTATKGRAKLIGNVKGRKNFAYRLARKAEAGETDWGYHKLTAFDAIDGGVIDPDIIAQAERDLPPDVFAELYLAKAADGEGNPFGYDAIKACTMAVGEAVGEPMVWGIDLAKSSDFTVCIALDKEKKVCRFARFQKPWLETVTEIQRMVGSTKALVDSTGVGDPILEALAKNDNGVRSSNYEGFKFSAPSKQQLMEGLTVAIQRGDVRFPEGPITSELEDFEYEHTRTGVRYSAPQGLHDDCVVALALAVKKAKTPGGWYM